MLERIPGMKNNTRIRHILIILCVAAFPALFFAERISAQEGPAEGDARLYIVNINEDIAEGKEAVLFRVTACDSSGAAKEIIGVAPVEADGSVFVLAPAGAPLLFEVLGADGEVLVKSERMYTLSSGEVRGLYRLNEPPGLAPPPPVNKLMPDAVSRDPDVLRPSIAVSGRAQ